jgi:tetratricopeptide (TPR) repeat protein
MKRITSLLLALSIITLLPTAAIAASAGVTIRIVDENGASIREALVLLSPVDDPEQQVTIGENDLGSYEDMLELAGESAEWTIKKIVVDGYLPVQVSINSSSADGDTIQEVEAMALDPSIPIPAIKLAAKGKATIELTMGELQVVMERFRSGRAAARAKAEKEQADRLAAAEQNKDYATALKLHKEGDIEGSLPHFRKAIEQNPNDKDLQVMFARVLYQAKQFAEFQTAASRALELDPGNMELRMMQYSSHRAAGDLQAALQALLAIKDAGGSAAQLLPHLRFIAQSMGQKKEAIPAYEAVLSMDAGDVDSCSALASIYFSAGEKAQSDKYLGRAIELAPERAASLYSELGSRLLAAAGKSKPRLAEAAEMFRKALEHDPGYAPAYKKLGLVYWNSEEYDLVREAFEKYLELLPAASDREQIEEYLSQLGPG